MLRGHRGRPAYGGKGRSRVVLQTIRRMNCGSTRTCAGPVPPGASMGHSRATTRCVGSVPGELAPGCSMRTTVPGRRSPFTSSMKPRKPGGMSYWGSVRSRSQRNGRPGLNRGVVSSRRGPVGAAGPAGAGDDDQPLISLPSTRLTVGEDGDVAGLLRGSGCRAGRKDREKQEPVPRHRPIAPE